MKPNYEDERGKIIDLLVTPEYSITHITFNKGAVRGNHYHKETDQYDLVLKGKLKCRIVDLEEKTFDFELQERESLKTTRGKKHAFKALEDSEIISICFGVRRGEDYSKDTYKLDTPLL